MSSILTASFLSGCGGLCLNLRNEKNKKGSRGRFIDSCWSGREIHWLSRLWRSSWEERLPLHENWFHGVFVCKLRFYGPLTSIFVRGWTQRGMFNFYIAPGTIEKIFEGFSIPMLYFVQVWKPISENTRIEISGFKCRAIWMLCLSSNKSDECSHTWLEMQSCIAHAHQRRHHDVSMALNFFFSLCLILYHVQW